MARRAFPYHPFLVAAVPVTSACLHNVGEVALVDVVPVLGGTLLLAGLLWVLFRALTRDVNRGALLASLTLLLLFSHGHIQTRLPVVRVGPVLVGNSSSLIVLWIVLIVAAAVALCRSRGRFEILTQVLNLALAGLLVLQVGQIAAYKVSAALSYRRLPPRAMVLAVSPPGPARSLPDVYYLIMDRYGSRTALKETYQFDNGPFLDFLRSRGFFVADTGYCNYPRTAHSLTSSLNMEYLNDLSDARLLPRDWMPLFHRIAHNHVAHAFKTLGYQVVHFGSEWQPTNRSSQADRNVNINALPELAHMIVSQSALGPPLRRLGWVDLYREKYDRVRHNFSKLAQLAADPQPTFAFAHFLVPHMPYVFGQQGEFVPWGTERGHSKIERFRAQVLYANGELMHLIDHLLTQSAQPPIIILQADEGPLPPDVTTEEFDYLTASTSDLRCKTGILNALFLPGVVLDRLDADLTPVNTFRFVLSEYFGANLERLPDRVFAFRDPHRIYDFLDVTDRVVGPPVDPSE